MFAQGQAYVALSRARSMEGLQITGFSPGCVKVCRIVYPTQNLDNNTANMFVQGQAHVALSGARSMEMACRSPALPLAALRYGLLAGQVFQAMQPIKAVRRPFNLCSSSMIALSAGGP